MGMSLSGSKGAAFSDPNIVPLIDVLLVLIIIFMVITPRVPTGLPAMLPQTAPQNSAPPPSNTIVVQVTASGDVLINQEQCDWNALAKRLSDIFKMRADKIAFVKGAEDVPFEEIARAIDVMRGAGIDHVGLITADQVVNAS